MTGHPAVGFSWPVIIHVLLIVLRLPCFSATPSTAYELEHVQAIKGRIVQNEREQLDQNAADKLLASIGEAGSWSAIDYENEHRVNWQTTQHLENTLTLARGYSAPESHMFKNDRLRNSVLCALDFWLEHDFKNSNWWHNQIGVPRDIAYTLLLLEGELSAAQDAKGMQIVSRAKLGMTGQNLVWVAQVVIVRAALERDPRLMKEAFDRVEGELRISKKEGIQADCSFHQHGSCLYSHGYGADFVKDTVDLAVLAHDTSFAFSEKTIATLSKLILDGHQWMTRWYFCDYGAIGRQISRKNQTARYLGDVARSMSALPTGRSIEFLALAERISGQRSPTLRGNRHFWRSDMMAHQREGYYTSVRMFSTRTVNTDYPYNSEGLKSHHIADGCTFILRSGDEYHDIFPVWDWQKIPGSTVEHSPKLSGRVSVRGKRSFVGGVSDGEYGVAAFDFLRGKLSARKSWFFFDKEFVCLGSSITCTSKNSVLTTLNQCHLRNEVALSRLGSTSVLGKGSYQLDGVSWVFHDHIGYLLFKPATISIRNEIQSGPWWEINHMYTRERIEKAVFSLWLDHGFNPRSASYAYIVVPHISKRQFETYVEKPPVEVLESREAVQAVRHIKSKITGIVFYRPGVCRGSDEFLVSVDRPCLILLRQTPARISVSVADPRQAGGMIVVDISKPVAGKQKASRFEKNRIRLPFHLPTGLHAGKSITQSRALPLWGSDQSRGLPAKKEGVAGLVCAEEQDT